MEVLGYGFEATNEVWQWPSAGLSGLTLPSRPCDNDIVMWHVHD